MEYIILESNGYTNAFTFQADVNAMIAEGYKPAGGLSVIPNDLLDKYDEGMKFYQAMYREIEVSALGISYEDIPAADTSAL